MSTSLSDNSQSFAPTSAVFVGRQPIYTKDYETIAYELLYRSDNANRADIVDGECATAELLLNTFSEIGLDRIVGKLPAFINISEPFILNGHSHALPKERVVLEVLETVKPTPAILEALTKLKKEGFTIAIDDFVYSPELVPLVELADIVKVDLPEIPADELGKHVEFLKSYPSKLLAEKVETHEEFQRCRDLGFDYFQGYFFCKPTMIQGERLQTNRLTMMRLVSRLQNPVINLNEIAEIIRIEPSLSLRLLRFVNSAYCGLNHKVESVRHAVNLAGIRRIKTLCSLSALAEVAHDRPPQFIHTVLVRARMSELLAEELGQQKTDAFFLVGLFSALDALLNVSMEEALDLVSVCPEVEQALTDRAGIHGEVLACVLEYEQGNWASVTCGNLDSTIIRNAYLQSLEWAQKSMDDTINNSAT